MNRRCFASLAAYAALAIIGADAAYAGVSDYNNAALYPAQVSAMQFENVMDSNNEVVWENWIVGFAKDLPSAKWATGAAGQTVTIAQLFCVAKDSDGSHLCELEIYFPNNGAEPVCSVSDVDESYAVQLDGINCPTSISFAP